MCCAVAVLIKCMASGDSSFSGTGCFEHGQLWQFEDLTLSLLLLLKVLDMERSNICQLTTALSAWEADVKMLMNVTHSVGS